MWRNCRSCCRGSRRKRKKPISGFSSQGGGAPILQSMRAVVQRVSRARVTADSRVTGEIGAGLMVLLGVGREDTAVIAASLAEKVANLRIFEDQQGKMNRSLLDVHGSALVVSQFTLYGDARGQRRPSFFSAAPPELAE